MLLAWETRMDSGTTSQHLYSITFLKVPWILRLSVVVINSKENPSFITSLWKAVLQDLDHEPRWHRYAQVYPYRSCSTLIRSIPPLGNPRALYPTQLSLAVDFLDNLDIDELRRVWKQLADLTAVEHPVLTADFYEQGLPMHDYYTRRLLNRI